MAKSVELAKRMSGLCFWAFQIAALGQSIKIGPEVGQQVPSFSAQDQDSQNPDSQIDHGAQRRHAGFFPFPGLVTVL
jgi:hypothetical protein